MNNSTCSSHGCNKKILCKKLCRNHYMQAYRPKKRCYTNKCIAENCNNPATPETSYCNFHLRRKRTNVPFSLPYKGRDRHVGALAGNKNPNWRGGTSEYKNYYEMIKNKKLKTYLVHGKCEICGSKGYEIHHIDFSKNNHSLDNLQLLCIACHKQIHMRK